MKKKVTFLVLHLGYGGIETSVINTVNCLINYYNVEIISFYNLKKNQVNMINKEVQIKYLYDGEPNREEFIKSVKKFRLVTAFREGKKSINIINKKKNLVINAIKNCKTDYLISTRMEFNILLSEYGRDDYVKVAQEHCYHNHNSKYLSTIKNKYNNIDYLLSLTTTLENDYKNLLNDNNHTKIVTIPNMLYFVPKEVSNLDSKNLITIGRVDTLKRNDDIIRAFSKIDNKDYTLTIIGDGKEENNLKKLTKELKVEDRVIFTGYKTKEEIKDYMLSSSIFLMASETEGLPMVLLEAGSYGLPSIVYEIENGVKDIIKDGYNGFIIKDRNENEYVNKINELISNEKELKELGKNARKGINSFTKEEVVKRWLNILK